MSDLIQIILIVAGLLYGAMVGAGVMVGMWFGARITARLLGREESVFYDKPGMQILDDETDELEST